MRLARRGGHDDPPMQAVVVTEYGDQSRDDRCPTPEALCVPEADALAAKGVTALSFRLRASPELVMQQVHHPLAGVNLIRLRGASTDGSAH